MSEYENCVNKLVDFWKKLDFNQNKGFVHPDDKISESVFYKDFEAYLSSDNYCDEDSKKKIHTGLIPAPYCGNLRTAKIFVLFLNPGFEESNYLDEADPKVKNSLIETLQQNFSENQDFPYFTLNPRFSNLDGAKWIRKKMDGVIQAVCKETGRKYKDVLKTLSQNLVSVELFPYHSASFSYKKEYEKMSSVAAVREYVECLKERAKNGEITLIVTRAADKWNVEESDNIVVYKGSECQSASLSESSKGGRAIKEKLCQLV